MNLIKKFINLVSSQRAFGLDFNDSKIRIIQFGKDSVLSWNQINIPEGVMDNYEIKDRNQFIQTMHYALSQAKGKVRGNRAVLSISENKIFTRVITLPTLNEKKAQEAIKWETESNIPISISEVYYDWQIIFKDKNKMEVLVVATPKKLIDNYLEIFNVIGIEIIACEAESSAISRSILGKKDKTGTILVIDIGMALSSFAIYRLGVPVFTSSSSVSGKMMTDAVAKKLNCNYRKAESYKIKVGLGSGNKEKKEALEIFEPILNLMTQEIKKTINFFDSNLSESEFSFQDENINKRKIEKIILCGGGSNLKGLKDFLTISTEKVVVNSNPWINLKLSDEEKNKIPDYHLQSFSNVIGLAIRGKEYENYNKFIAP